MHAVLVAACTYTIRKYVPTHRSIREFKDVVFEDVVFDNNRFDIDVTIKHNV